VVYVALTDDPGVFATNAGRMERSYGTWQGGLPQELRRREIHNLEQANEFLRCEYIAEFNGPRWSRRTCLVRFLRALRP
jgi:hypothetical protein